MGPSGCGSGCGSGSSGSGSVASSWSSKDWRAGLADSVLGNFSTEAFALWTSETATLVPYTFSTETLLHVATTSSSRFASIAPLWPLKNVCTQTHARGNIGKTLILHLLCARVCVCECAPRVCIVVALCKSEILRYSAHRSRFNREE